MARLLVKDIIKTAMEYAELPDDAVTDTFKLSLYNAKSAELHNMLIQADEDYAVKTTGSTAITADTPTYQLPSDFYRARKVFIVDNGRHWPAEKFSVDQMWGVDIDDITAGNYDLWYVPRARKVENENEEVPFVLAPNWEEYIEWSMAVVFLGKRQEDPAFAIQERDRLFQLITAHAEPRDEEMGQIVDVSRRWTLAENDQYVRDGGVKRFYAIEGTTIRFLEVT